jgi:hypothetical protein
LKFVETHQKPRALSTLLKNMQSAVNQEIHQEVIQMPLAHQNDSNHENVQTRQGGQK